MGGSSHFRAEWGVWPAEEAGNNRSWAFRGQSGLMLKMDNTTGRVDFIQHTVTRYCHGG